MLKIKQFVFNPFGVSSFIIYDSESKAAIAIDPGMLNSAEQKEFDSYIAENNLKLTQIVNTHLHLDHCFGNNYVRDKYGIKVAAHPDDAFLGNSLAEQASRFGIRLTGIDTKADIDIELKDGDNIEVGAHTLKVLHVPGHSPGSIALYCAEGDFVIAGDVLFKGSIGRTDLQGGNLDTLLDSIHSRLMTLPDSTNVLPGHDRFTTIGAERATNPYI
ncbi:MAG: MBL fold metallo-hydrolase [Muribaculaceae bacterium]|nr:MBL fold metallo-hydrolase [Muribaculaceae bacterium]